MVPASAFLFIPVPDLLDAEQSDIRAFKKISRNRLRTASVIPRKKVLIPRHSEVYGRDYSEARNGRKWKEVLQKIVLSKQN